MEEKPERGMRHKPARVDAQKYQVTLRSCTAHPLPSVVQLYVNARLFHASQVAPTQMRSVEHRSSEVEAAEAVGLRAWHCDVCSDAQVFGDSQLGEGCLAKSRRLSYSVQDETQWR